MNKNPFYEFFKAYIPKILLVWMILMMLDVIVPCISDMRETILYDSSNLVFINRTSDMWYTIAFLITLIFINYYLPQMLNIRGDRKACINAFFKMIAILTVVAISVGLISEFVMDYICKLYGVSSQFYTRTSTVEWLGEGMDNMPVILIIRLINSFFVISISYMLGSMYYRLKSRYNILIFIITPGIFFGVVLNIIFSTTKFGDILWNLIVELNNRPFIYIILEILLIGLFIIAGNKFLNKAPIAEYAHDIG